MLWTNLIWLMNDIDVLVHILETTLQNILKVHGRLTNKLVTF